MEAWEEFLSEDDRRMRFNERFRGLVYVRPAGAGLARSVDDYMRGFGHAGVTASQVASAVGANGDRWVRQALVSMVGDGDVRLEEQPTRGNGASKRKVYFSLIGTPVMVEDLLEECTA